MTASREEKNASMSASALDSAFGFVVGLEAGGAAAGRAAEGRGGINGETNAL